MSAIWTDEKENGYSMNAELALLQVFGLAMLGLATAAGLVWLLWRSF